MAEGVELRDAGHRHRGDGALAGLRRRDRPAGRRPTSTPPSTPRRASRASPTAAGRAGRTADAPGARAPQGRHRHAPGRRPARRGGRRSPGPIEAEPGARPAPRCSPTARWPTSPATAFTATSSSGSTPCVAEIEAAGDRRARASTPPTPRRAIDHPAARLDLVRCGIGIYGIAPAPALAGRVPLVPALSLRARVSHVKRVAAGEGISYGLRYRPERRDHHRHGPARLRRRRARAGSAPPGGEVLVGGVRRPIAGSVTMDQILVDCGDDPVAVGDEVVLLGAPGRRRHHRRRLGRAPRHHRLRDRVRHQPPRPPPLPGGPPMKTRKAVALLAAGVGVGARRRRRCYRADPPAGRQGPRCRPTPAGPGRRSPTSCSTCPTTSSTTTSPRPTAGPSTPSRRARAGRWSCSTASRCGPTCGRRSSTSSPTATG